MARRRIAYLLVLTGALAGQLFDIGYLVHFIFILTLCLPVVGLLVSLPAMLGCRWTLSVEPAAAARGEKARWRVAVRGRWALPLARASCTLRVKNRMTGEERTTRVSLTGISWGTALTKAVDTNRCGMVECRLERGRVYDCLGLFALPARTTGVGSLLVCPLPEPPGLLRLPERYGVPAPVLRGRASSGEDYDLRPYQSGDNVRAIHWKMSAKRDELVVREPLDALAPTPVLTFLHFGPEKELERTLDRLAGYGEALLERQRPFQVWWAQPVTGEIRRAAVADRGDWNRCLRAVLSDPAPLTGRSVLDTPVTGSQDQPIHHIHITGEEDRHENT